MQFGVLRQQHAITTTTTTTDNQTRTRTGATEVKDAAINETCIRAHHLTLHKLQNGAIFHSDEAIISYSL